MTTVIPAATYVTAHNNIARHRGKASSHTCTGCGKPAAEWALLHTAREVETNARGLAFSVDVDDYAPMCCSCHRAYDRSRITHCPHGHEYTAANTILAEGRHRKCRTCQYARNRARPLSEASRLKKIEYERRRRAAMRASTGVST